MCENLAYYAIGPPQQIYMYGLCDKEQTSASPFNIGQEPVFNAMVGDILLCHLLHRYQHAPVRICNNLSITRVITSLFFVSFSLQSHSISLFSPIHSLFSSSPFIKSVGMCPLGAPGGMVKAFVTQAFQDFLEQHEKNIAVVEV